MVDPVIGQGSLQWLGDVVLADDLGKGVRTVAPVERERGLRALGRPRLGEQRLVLSVLDPVRPRLWEPQVVLPRFFHACTLCPVGDSWLRCQMMGANLSTLVIANDPTLAGMHGRLGACDHKRPDPGWNIGRSGACDHKRPNA